MLLWRFRQRIGRAPLAALGCFVVGLAPVLGFFDVYYFRYSYVADHFQYLAGIGLIALMAAALTRGLEWLAGGESLPRRFLSRNDRPSQDG